MNDKSWRGFGIIWFIIMFIIMIVGITLGIVGACNNIVDFTRACEILCISGICGIIGMGAGAVMMVD